MRSPKGPLSKKTGGPAGIAENWKNPGNTGSIRVPVLCRSLDRGKIGVNPKESGCMDMDKQTVTDVMQKTRELMDAPTCSREAGEAARRWLEAVGTESEKEETRRYIEELEADIMPVDTLIAFAQSEQGAAYFGAETAAGIAAHAMEIKAAGALYCDCPACAAAAAILEKKAALLA